MATAAPSPLAASVEKTNGSKLSRLLIDGGTTVLRKTFDHYHPPANLASDLNSNYSILNNLLRKRVLNGHQWDKLFPPGGGVPDSNTFDITLLFLLLTNICGLTPPLTGWHTKPSPGDNTLEANLARVKFFRNALYGHVTSTGVDATSFSSFWQEISITLHSLGLDQSEIDRLRAEQGGEQDCIDTLIRWADSEEDIKTQLKDIQQSQTKIQTIVEEVRQTQQEQNEMQREHQRTLKSTQKAVEDTQQLLVEVLKTHQETQQKHEKDHREIRGDVLQIKDKVESLEQRRSEDKESEVLNKKLAVVDTDAVIQNYAKKHEQGTRKSILEKVKLWLEDRSSENRVLVLSGNAGMGKSVIAAVVCKTMDQDGRLAGCHFCQHNKARGRKPQVMLQSLARKLCDVLPKYKNVLAEKLSGNLGVDINSVEVGELFELLFEEPLGSVGDPGRNFLLVIDGLDECEYQSRNELLDVIANHFSTLPVWLRFFVTTRPEINIADRLQKFNPFQLEQDDEENVEDIRLFLERQLQSSCEEVINELTRKADGHILFAFLMVRFIEENGSRPDPEELRKILPSGVSDVYKSYFDRMEKELKNIEELTISADQLLSFLSAVAAAREPLPLDFVSKLLLSDTKSPAGHRKVRKAIECISTLLPVQDGCIHFFHKSVKDWLTDRTAYGRHDFSVDEKQGHLALSELCAGELNDVKRRGVHGGEFSDTAKYALQHGVHHMVESEEVDESTRSFEEIVNNYVTDLDMVYAKLCVNNTASSEDIILTQQQEAFQLLSSESQSALSTMWSLLRKHHERLSTRPSIFFQVMVNSGGDMFASKANELLNTKYHEVPYMEYVHKEVEKDQLEEIQAVFRCTSQVACFDISPQWDFMVSECRDGTIQLWSLKTGELRWKRPATVSKRYSNVDDHYAFRMASNSPVLSCYRSVVFHPVEARVLPGTLSHAYSFNGDLLPLFPHSKCRFLVCSVNGDKSKMITDSPYDAKCLVMWNLKSGEEIHRATRNEVVLSFAWSPDGKVLAISHISGLICLVDTLNCFATLAEVTLKKPFGMIKFGPNLQFLFCWRKPKQRMVEDRYLKGIRLNVSKSPRGFFSVDVLDNNADFEPWVYESCSNSGFLMGDPISCVFGSHQDCFGSFWFPVKKGLAFVLNEQSVIRACSGSDLIVMFRPDKGKVSYRTLRDVAFAVDGKTVYGVTERNEAVVSFDVSSGELKAEKQIDIRRGRNAPISRATLSNNPPDYGFCLVPVSNGVLLKQGGAAVQLWNFELSRQLRSWSSLVDTYIMPVSDHCVACVGTKFEVSILDTSRGDIVKTISLCHEGYQSTYPLLDKEAIVCNSKYQLLSTDRHSVQLSDGTSILWKRVFEDSELLYSWNIPGILSPTEEFVLISAKTSQNRQEVHVLDASSGATRRILCTVDDVMSYAFVSDTECVMHCGNRRISESLCLQLFSVKTGDLLSVLDMDYRPLCLASFPKKGLIAIGLWQSKRMCAFIKVRMPRDKDNRESKERSSDDDDDDFQSKKEDDENKDDKGDEFHDNDDNHNSDDVEVGGDDVGDDNGGGDEITEEQELLQQIQELSLEGRVEDLDESDSDKIKIHEGTITSEGTHWALKRGSTHVFFPPNAVSQPTSIVAHRWKCSARSPPLQEHESVVSNVIEISTKTGDELKFDAKAKLVLSHGAPDLQGYELVIKKLIDWKSNEWEEVDGTKALQCLKAVEEDFPPHPRDVPEIFFPVAQADITECSTYAVVCRLKPSPAYAITSSGGSFSHPDYPRVTVTIPENAVTPEAKIPLVLKVQEVPGEEFKDQDVFLGPILRVSCSQIVEFSKPVTIQLPVSLRSDQERIPVPSTCRVRVLFLNSDDEEKKWMEITDGLKCPVHFDGTFVRFQVERFSGYTCVFEWYKEDFSGSGVITYLTSLIWKQPLLGVFFSYFNELDRAYSQDVLHLICCPAHMRERVVQELENANVVPSEENSRKKLIPGHDKAFVFVSGGITPAEIEDMEDFHLMFESDNRDKKQLPVRLINDQVLSHVEFRSSPDPNAKNLLSRLNFRLSSMKLDLTKTPVEFFGVPLNDQTLLDADPNYVLSACRPFLSHDTYEELVNHLNSGYRAPKQALMSLLRFVAGLDPNSQDECFEAVVSALREASNEGFLHVIERLQEARQKVNIALAERSEVINKVSEKVCSSWKRLARELELRAGQIDNISEEEQDDEERCRKTLRTWCQLNGRNSTIRKLMISLTKIGKAEVNHDVMRCLHLVGPD